MRGKDALVPDEMPTRPRNQQGESSHQTLTVQHQTERAVGERVLEGVAVAAVRELGQAAERERRAGAVSAQLTNYDTPERCRELCDSLTARLRQIR